MGSQQETNAAEQAGPQSEPQPTGARSTWIAPIKSYPAPTYPIADDRLEWLALGVILANPAEGAWLLEQFSKPVPLDHPNKLRELPGLILRASKSETARAQLIEHLRVRGIAIDKGDRASHSIVREFVVRSLRKYRREKLDNARAFLSMGHEEDATRCTSQAARAASQIEKVSVKDGKA